MKIVVVFMLSVNLAGSVRGAPAQPRITDISVNGSGCPVLSVFITKSEDEQSFRINFGQFIAEPDRIESEAKDCTILTKIEIPQGYSVNLRPTSFGVAHSITGSSLARVAIDTLFAGHKASVSAQLGHNGFTAVNTGETGWSPCGVDSDARHVIKLNVRKSAQRDSARAEITESQSINLAWRACRSS